MLFVEASSSSRTSGCGSETKQSPIWYLRRGQHRKVEVAGKYDEETDEWTLTEEKRREEKNQEGDMYDTKKIGQETGE
jgi:hypothetical protein